jgi:hypothetical protein
MTDNNSMNKARKIVMYYSLGMALSFWIIALIHLNSFLFEHHYLYANWYNIMKTSIISGAPFGLAIWALLVYRFPKSFIDLKFIFNLIKPNLIHYLIGIVLALFLIAGTQIYILFFDTDYCLATYYKIFGFAVLLGIPLAIGFYTLKITKL